MENPTNTGEPSWTEAHVRAQVPSNNAEHSQGTETKMATNADGFYDST